MKFLLTLILFSSLQAQTLDEYLIIATANNPEVHAQLLRFEAAMQDVVQQSSLPDPKLALGHFISPIETRVGSQRTKISLSQSFPWFGTLKAQKNKAALLAQAEFDAYENLLGKLHKDVKTSYAQISELEHFIALEDENKRIIQTYKSISKQNYENGKGSLVDVLRADMALQASKTQVILLREKRRPLIVLFNSLLNRELEENVVVNIKGAWKEKTPIIVKSLAEHPSLKGVDRKIDAAQWQIKIAEKQGWPNLNVGVDYAFIDARKSTILQDNGQDALMPSLGLSLPIFRKKYKAAKKKAKYLRDALQLDHQHLFNALSSSLQLAQYKLSEATHLIKLHENLIIEAEQSLRLLLSAYSSTAQNFDEVIRMQQQVIDYKKERVKAIAKYQIAVAKIEYLNSK